MVFGEVFRRFDVVNKFFYRLFIFVKKCGRIYMFLKWLGFFGIVVDIVG